jgi:hypothetical protein
MQSPAAGLCLGWRVGLIVNNPTGPNTVWLISELVYGVSRLKCKTSQDTVSLSEADLIHGLFQKVPGRNDARTPEKFPAFACILDCQNYERSKNFDRLEASCECKRPAKLNVPSYINIFQMVISLLPSEPDFGPAEIRRHEPKNVGPVLRTKPFSSPKLPFRPGNKVL